MGLEPTTFCMASVGSVRARSRPFAESPDLQVVLRSDRHERTRTNDERDHYDHGPNSQRRPRALPGVIRAMPLSSSPPPHDNRAVETAAASEHGLGELLKLSLLRGGKVSASARTLLVVIPKRTLIAFRLLEDLLALKHFRRRLLPTRQRSMIGGVAFERLSFYDPDGGAPGSRSDRPADGETDLPQSQSTSPC